MTTSPNTGAMAQVHGQPQAHVLTPPPQGTIPQTMLHLPHQSQHQHQHHQVLAGQGSQALNAVAGSGGAAEIQGGEGSISGEGVQSLPNGSYSLDVGHLGVPSTTSQLLQQQQQQHQHQQQQHGQQQLLALQQQQQQQHHHHNLHELQEHHQQDDSTVVNQPDPTSNHARPQEEPIIPPNQDQEFETLEAAQESAERYARSVNTVVIVKRTTKDKNGNIVQKDLACERQGSYVTSGKKGPQVNARTKRCGCPWMISVGFSKRRGNRDGKRGRYTKVVLEHNHPLEPIPAELPPRKQPHVRAKTAAAAMSATAIGGGSVDATKLDAGAQSASARTMASDSSGTILKTKPRRANAKPASSANGSSSNNPPRDIPMSDASSSTTSRSDMDFEVARYSNPGTLLTESQAAAAVASNALSGLESLSSEVMSALGGSGGGAGSGNQVEPSVSWDDLKMRMNQIPWNLQAKVMRGLMDVLQVTQQTFQVPPIPGSRSADAEANAAATAAAIADVVGSLPPNYNPHSVPSQSQPQQQQQQPQLRQQVQSHQPLQTQSLRHPNRHAYVSSAVPVENIGSRMSSTTATSELLQLHRAETTDMHGARMGNSGSGHSRQQSLGNSHRGHGDEQTSNGAMIPQSSLQSTSAIPTVVPTLPESTSESSVGSSSSTVSSIPLVTTDAPLLTPMPVLHNVHMDTTPLQSSLDTTQQQLQNNILQQQRQHTRQANSLVTTNHQRSLSPSSVAGSSAPGVTSTLSLAPDNASMIAHSRNSSSNSHRGSLESSPMLMQQALADVASRIHAQVQLQAQVDADTEAVVTAALNMNPLPRNNNGNSNNNTAVPEIVGSSESTTPVSTTHASGASTANATPSPIPMNILDDATMRGLDLESYTQHLQQMHQQQQRLQLLQQQQHQLQQQQQQTQQQQLQQQNPQLQQQPQQQPQQQQQQPDLLHTHSLNSNDDRHGIDLAGEPARKRVKS